MFLFLAVCLSPKGQAQLPAKQNSLRWRQRSKLPIQRPFSPPRRRHFALLPQNVNWQPCPAEAASFGASCGYVLVQLDRLRPHGEEIGIYFEVYGHSNTGPAESAIMANFGGPGSGTTT